MKYFKEKIASDNPLAQDATLECYLIDMSEKIRWKARPAVILCPGGAYYFTNDRESEPVALSFLAKGFHAFSLRYSTEKAIYPTALSELGKTVKMVRAHAEEWNVDPNKIILVGFSAGGHLASEFAAKWHEKELQQLVNAQAEEIRPNALVLGYPVITLGKYTHVPSAENLLGENRTEEAVLNASVEKNVTDHFPPTFLWHTETDPTVPVQNSLLLAASLAEQKVPFELHIFPYGSHGLGLANNCTVEEDRHVNDYCDVWFEEAVKFLRHYLEIEK